MTFPGDHLQATQYLGAQPDQGRRLPKVVNVDCVQICVDQVDETRLHAHHLWV